MITTLSFTSWHSHHHWHGKNLKLYVLKIWNLVHVEEFVCLNACPEALSRQFKKHTLQLGPTSHKQKISWKSWVINWYEGENLWFLFTLVTPKSFRRRHLEILSLGQLLLSLLRSITSENFINFRPPVLEKHRKDGGCNDTVCRHLHIIFLFLFFVLSSLINFALSIVDKKNY
jgi:hypothetical protein